MWDDPIDDDDFYIALGKIAYSSSRMFESLESLIRGMLSLADGVTVLTVDFTYAQITHLANTLTDRLVKGKKEFATLTAILDDASRWYGVRNKVVHGEWMASRSGRRVFWCTRWRARGKLTYTDDKFTINDLFDVAKGLEDCRTRLEKFMLRQRFLAHTMFDEDVGVRRLAQRVRARQREKARIQAREKKARQK